MHDVLRDPDVMSAIIRRRVLRAMAPAVRLLDRVARGDDRFADDHQRLACLILARFAPGVLACAAASAAAADEHAEEEEEWRAKWCTPEKLALLEKLRRFNAPESPEAGADAWGQRFLEGQGMPVGLDTLEKARAFGREQFDKSQARRAQLKRLLAKAKRQRRRR